jgi:hypothetical protein
VAPFKPQIISRQHGQRNNEDGSERTTGSAGGIAERVEVIYAVRIAILRELIVGCHPVGAADSTILMERARNDSQDVRHIGSSNRSGSSYRSEAIRCLHRDN